MSTIRNAEFEISVALGCPYLETSVPQIALVGKSNVGKSSLINAVCNRRKLAKTSSQPGKTRLINYFRINDGEYYFVDLPGYGFAKAPKTEQQKWGELIEGYLRSGKVTHIFLLIDSRHAPTLEDKQMLRWIEYYNIPYTILATKTDKIAKSKVPHALSTLHKQIGAISPVIGCSAENKRGMQEMEEKIEQIVFDVALEKTSELIGPKL